MTRAIAVTFDYRCPFAYNGHAAVVARRARAAPTSRCATSRSPSTRCTSRRASRRSGSASPASWGTGVLALLYGIAVRDAFPDQFVDAHLALFAARHDKGLKLGHEDVLRDAVTSAGLDADAVAEEVASGRPLETLADGAHRSRRRAGASGASRRSSRATKRRFVRFMERGRSTISNACSSSCRGAGSTSSSARRSTARSPSDRSTRRQRRRRSSSSSSPNASLHSAWPGSRHVR